jgi:hypothetical protein
MMGAARIQRKLQTLHGTANMSRLKQSFCGVKLVLNPEASVLAIAA